MYATRKVPTFLIFSLLLSASLLSACLRKPDPLPTPTQPLQIVISTPVLQTPTPFPTYQEPTATPTPTETLTPIPGKAGMPVILPLEKIKPAADDDRANFPWLLSDLVKQFNDPALGDPLEYDVDLKTSGLTWDNWWCAISEAVLNDTLSKVRFEYQINGEMLDSTNAYKFAQNLGGTSTCQVTMFALQDFPPGQHILTYAFIVDNSISDGFTQFKPGRYEIIMKVNKP